MHTIRLATKRDAGELARLLTALAHPTAEEDVEDTLARAGCGLLEITSHERLVEVHGFYEHLGYERTSIRLAKILDPDRSPRLGTDETP